MVARTAMLTVAREERAVNVQQRSLIYPAVGKGPEVLSALEEWVQHLNTTGGRANLSRRVSGGPGPLLATTVIYPGVADLQQAAKARQKQPEFLSLQQRLSTVLREGVTTELHEVLLAPARGQAAPPVGYSTRHEFYPALGKQREVRSLLTEFAQHLQRQGRRVVLNARMFGDGPAFVGILLYTDLAEMEQQNEQGRQDETAQDFGLKIAALSRTVAKSELFEVVVPFPN